MSLSIGYSSLITHHSSLSTQYSALSTQYLIEKSLHAMKPGGRFSEARLLFERFAVVSGCLDVLAAGFVNATQVEMWKRVRFITRRIESAFEPANTTVSVTFCQKVAADIVV